MCHGRHVPSGHVKVKVTSLHGGTSLPYPWTETIYWFNEPVMAQCYLIWPIKFMKAMEHEHQATGMAVKYN